MNLRMMALLVILFTQQGWSARYYEPATGRFMNVPIALTGKNTPYQFGAQQSFAVGMPDEPVSFAPHWNDWIYAPVLVPVYGTADQDKLAGFMIGPFTPGLNSVNNTIFNSIFMESLIHKILPFSKGPFSLLEENILKLWRQFNEDSSSRNGFCCAPRPDNYLNDLVDAGLVESWETNKNGEIMIKLVNPELQGELEDLLPNENIKFVHPEE